MKPTLKRIAVLAAAGAALAASNAGAANSFHTPGDLILFFQEEGGSNTVYVSLGNTATAFRGAASGVTEDLNQVNFMDISSSLVSAFGVNWATNGNIYAGLVGNWGQSNTSAVLQNGDPHRTIYVSQGRGSVGTVGVADSVGYAGFSSTNMTAMSTSIQGMNSPFEDQLGTNGIDAAQAVLATSVSNIDDQNPFSSPGIQGNALGNTIGGGIQQKGDADIFGTFDGVGDVEFALDLHRILARATGGTGTGNTFVSGQVDGPHRASSFEGTITIGTDGQVSFLTAPIPEPSTSLLAGLAAGAAFLRRRRNA